MSYLYKIFFVILIQSFQRILGIDSDVGPIVNTKVGSIRGVTATDGEYDMFMGILYAKVDKENPFGPSTPYPVFEDIFEANDDTSMCPQTEEFNGTIAGTLDCLRLNIYVPNSASAHNLLPVMVHIHGGGFSQGFAGRFLFGPSFLVKHDVILVTLSYRLGPYGFMCLHTPDVPGNQGLKDQLIALRWIRDNIQSFGGDVNAITVLGGSAGARSIDLHLLSNHEKLFNKAIMQSGSSLNPDMIPEPDTKSALKLANHLGFATNDQKEALSFLGAKDTYSVIAAAKSLGLTFKPCVEKEMQGVEIFITEHPVNQNIVPKVNKTPILIGNVHDEMIEPYAHASPQAFANMNVFYNSLKNGFNFEDDYLLEMEKMVRQFYLGDEPMSEEMKFSIVNFASDFTYNYAVPRNIAKFLDNGAEKVYYYIFSYVGERNFVRRKSNILVGGAAHSDEHGYLFNMQYISEKPSAKDQLMIDRMTTIWTNFAKYGDPTPVTSSLLPVKWEPITNNSVYYYYNIDSTIELGMRPFHQRMTFWDLFYRINFKYEKGFRENRASVSVSHNSLLLTCILAFINYKL